MYTKQYYETLHLVESLTSYREDQKEEMIKEDNEMCELYFTLDDEPNDKRGSF